MNAPTAVKADTGVAQRALSAHATIGLIVSALLYLLCVTGTVIVFKEEWQRVEQPGAPEMASISPEAMQTGIRNVLATEAGKPTTTHLYVHLPVPALPRTTVTTDTQAVHLAADGSIVGPEENGWATFLEDIHYRLTMPGLTGYAVVGAFGTMMLALIFSGVAAHPRIFRDAFHLRARNRTGVGLSDWHNRLGVWTLPFAVAIALTGAVLGLSVVSGYGLASAFYGGDIEKVYGPVFGEEHPADATPAALPDAAAALRAMATDHPEAHPYYVVLHDPGTAGQAVQIIAEYPKRLIFGEYFTFDAAGRLHGTAGLADGTVGQQIAASNYRLHFGNFGGLPVKIAYAVFGIALCVVCATGVSIWLGKRARRGHREPRLRAAWDAVVWGVPLALTLALLARLLIGNAAPMAAIFWGLSVALVFAGIVFGARWSTAGRDLARGFWGSLAATTVIATAGAL
ncbi:PepSY-associated TM helix domain-containing protein [Sphingosinithalassobacter sp. LHW66-3]|uniref:PepSY-associated TM helix domain-containing protein n=1 Tax=Sphingosinithalassobacter sp. LHW66-3 TaxID=3424718 RepID=UPI003D6C48BC